MVRYRRLVASISLMVFAAGCGDEPARRDTVADRRGENRETAETLKPVSGDPTDRRADANSDSGAASASTEGPGETSSEDTPAARASSPTQVYKGDVGITSDSLRIGIIYPQSGVFGPFFDQYPKVYQAAFNDVNDREKGIYGRKLMLATGDEGESASLAQSSVRQLATRVFGLTSFVQEAAVASVTEDRSIPTMALIGDVTLAGLRAELKYTFIVGTPQAHLEPRNGPSLVRTKFPQLVDRTALVYTSDVYGGAGPAFQKTAVRHGVEVIHVEKLALNQTTCVNAVANVQRANPEIVYLHSSSLEAACFLRDARAAGFRPQWAGRLAQITNTASGNSNEGMVGLTGLRGMDSPEGRRLQQTYRKYYPNETLQDVEPNLRAWAAAQMWIQWLKAAGPRPTRRSFPATLENHGPFPSGLVHSPDYAPGVHVGSEHTIAGVVRNGNVVITDNVWKTTYDGIKDPRFFPWR